jgi:hypothetical protein
VANSSTVIPLVTPSHAGLGLCWSKLKPASSSFTHWNKKKSAGARSGEQLDAVGGDTVLDDGGSVDRSIVLVDKPLLGDHLQSLDFHLLHEVDQDLMM